MKNTIAILFFAMIALNTFPSFAEKPVVSPSASIAGNHTITRAAEARVLTNRLKEIHTLSKGNLGVNEKASLRKEVLSIEQQLNAAAADGVYISVGALILIIILLIILL